MDLILERIPGPKGILMQLPITNCLFRILWLLGRLAVGRVKEGTFKPNLTVSQSLEDGTFRNIRIQNPFGMKELPKTN